MTPDTALTQNGVKDRRRHGTKDRRIEAVDRRIFAPRSIHLYLGCILAPLLFFFAVSGLWETYALGDYEKIKILEWLSTVHTSHGLKTGTLTSPLLQDYVLVMASGFIVMICLGVFMALKYAQNRMVAYCFFAFGVLCPLSIILITTYMRGTFGHS